jgi:hypothetical protein
MSRLTIYYGRVRLEDGQHPDQTSLVPHPVPILRQAVEEAKTVDRYQHNWVLANLESDESAGCLTGRLGYPARELIVRQDLDAETHDFVDREFELPDASTAAFLLDYNTGALAFAGDAATSPSGFLKTFVALLDSSGRGSFSGELIQVARDYREFLLKVDKVTKVAFEVRPTNPRDRAIFRPLDVGMKASNADKQRVTLENQREGLQVVPPGSRDDETDNPAVMGIEMNEEGYGNGYRIDGELDGQILRFESRGGGLLKDVVDDAPEAPIDRIQPLREHFGRRLALITNPQSLRRPPTDAAEGEDESDVVEAELIEEYGVESEARRDADTGEYGAQES